MCGISFSECREDGLGRDHLGDLSWRLREA